MSDEPRIIKAGDGGKVEIKGGDGGADHDGGSVIITGDNGPVHITGGAGGSVIAPEPTGDDSSFRPAKEIRERFPELCKHHDLMKFVEDHGVRWRRPVSAKTGQPHPRRVEIHIGELSEAIEKEQKTDPLDLPAEQVDAAVAEAERRKAEVRRRGEK